MKVAKVITEVKVEEVRACSNTVEIQRVRMDSLRHLGDDFFIDNNQLSEKIDTELVPLHRFLRADKDQVSDMYIGYTKEVQDILGIPYECLKNEIGSLESSISCLQRSIDYTTKDLNQAKEIIRKRDAQLDSIKSLGIIGRLKFLFTRSLPC